MIAGQLRGRRGRDTVRRSALRAIVVALPVLDERAHDARLDQRSAVGDGADRGGHLQGRDADLVAHRHGRQRARVEPRGIPHDAGVLAAEVRTDRLAEPEAADIRPSRSGPSRSPTLMAPTLLDLTITSVNGSAP